MSLAQRAVVVVSSIAMKKCAARCAVRSACAEGRSAYSARQTPRPVLSNARGFTLIELMVVVILVGIMVMLAVPSMSSARYDRRVYDDAASIAQVVRDARARAMGRGAAIVVQLSNASSSRGSYLVYEAVTGNSSLTTANIEAGVENRTPDSRCRRGDLNLLDTTKNVLVESTMLDNQTEISADILSVVVGPTGIVPTAGSAFLCFTPGGHTYYSEGTTANFDSALPMTSPMTVIVRRRNVAGSSASPDFGLRRRVVIAPSGNTRVVSSGPQSGDPS